MRLTLTAILLAGLLAAPGAARADAAGDAILKKMETRFNNFRNITQKFLLTVPTKSIKVKFKTITVKGGQRLVKMTYPGDVKGMHMLVQSREEMYIYLPAFRKVRRLAGHVRNQGFNGSGFTYDDMSISYWSKEYSATVTKDNATHVTLKLVKRAGRHPAFPRLKMTIRKDHFAIHKIEYITRRGKRFKTQKFARYVCRADNSHCNPGKITMIEHTRGNLVSIMKLRGKTKYNRKYSARMFTVRYLLRSAN